MNAPPLHPCFRVFQARLAVAAFILLGTLFPPQSGLAQVSQTNRAAATRQKWGGQSLETVRTEAERGGVEAMFELFWRYHSGTGGDDDESQGMKWLSRAAEAGHPEAQCFRGFYFEYPGKWNENYPKDIPNQMREAVTWYRRSAAQGHTGGQYHLALCYLQGKGVELDEDRGLALMRQAADAGHLYGIVKLADLYSRGFGEPREEKDRPINLLFRAAERDFAGAYDPLIFRLQQGLGTDRDLMVACQWYCRAAVHHFRRYNFQDKILSAERARQAEPFSAALSLYLRAAKAGDADALLQIGRMYASGTGVPKDDARAWQWYKLAGQSGSAAAAANCKEIEAHLAPQELAAAREASVALEKQLAKLRPFLPQ